MENYTLSDIAAVNGHDGFGGANSWVLIILFALIFGGGNFFGNKSTGVNDYATAASQQEILFGQQFQGLDNKIDRIGNGIADATFALNNAITTEGRSMQTALANCCCENQKNVDAVRFDMANYAASIQTAIHTEAEATRNLLQQNKIESLQGQINQLSLNASLAGVVRYPAASTYNAGANPFCGSGCCGNNV